MKVETHNHPTAIAPFAGAATGCGGEMSDEVQPVLVPNPRRVWPDFSVSNLHIPGFGQPWEDRCYGKPGRIVSPPWKSCWMARLVGHIQQRIRTSQSDGLFPYLRGNRLNGEVRGYPQAHHAGGWRRQYRDDHTHKTTLPVGALLIQLGGPGMLIGLGGGAASSMDTGPNAENLDFDSVQRGNPEMQRRAQEVIDRCWQLGDNNPILSIHDVGAGGISNALPNWCMAVAKARVSSCVLRRRRSAACRRCKSGATKRRSVYVLAIPPERLAMNFPRDVRTRTLPVRRAGQSDQRRSAHRA